MYRVTIDDGTNTFEADTSWFDDIQDAHGFDQLEAAARAYWRGEIRDEAMVEVLAEGDLIIESQVRSG